MLLVLQRRKNGMDHPHRRYSEAPLGDEISKQYSALTPPEQQCVTLCQRNIYTCTKQLLKQKVPEVLFG